MEMRTRARVVNQQLVPLEPLELPEGAEVSVTIQLPDSTDGDATLVEKNGVLVIRTQTPIDVEQLIEDIRAERANTLTLRGSLRFARGT